ncbi:hypothetical protein M879_22805 [Mycobacteroides abscessus V06705]|nr:hypothetical protein M879_22805 [Mycobacteroides abscessus V06705]
MHHRSAIVSLAMMVVTGMRGTAAGAEGMLRLV